MIATQITEKQGAKEMVKVTPSKADGLIMAPVDAPPVVGPRRTMYVDIVERLAQDPGQWFHVRRYKSTQSAQSGRAAVVKAAEKIGCRVQATAVGDSLYAKAEKKRGRRPNH